MNVIYFAKPEQAAIFAQEIKGQLSDGYWENTLPHNHWRPWSSAEVRVAEKGGKVGRNFYVKKENYNLTAAGLLDAVGVRMRTYAVLAQLGYSLEQIDTLNSCVDLSGLFKPEIPDYFRKFAAGGQEHYAERLAALEALDLVDIHKQWAVGMVKYDTKALKTDLNEMKTVLRTYIQYLGETAEEKTVRLQGEALNVWINEVYRFEHAMRYVNEEIKLHEHFPSADQEYAAALEHLIAS